MIRQLAASGINFRTPRFVDYLNINPQTVYRGENVSFLITEETTIELNRVSVGDFFAGVEVDVLGYVENIPFVLYATYHGRSVPLALKSPENKKCGIVEIKVDPLAYKFKQDKYRQYLDVLKSYLAESVEGKSWIYHPRYNAAREQAERKFAMRASPRVSLPYQCDNITRLQTTTAKIQRQVERTHELPKKRYKCVMCGSKWFGSSRYCKTCETHMFTTDEVDENDRT